MLHVVAEQVVRWKRPAERVVVGLVGSRIHEQLVVFRAALHYGINGAALRTVGTHDIAGGDGVCCFARVVVVVGIVAGHDDTLFGTLLGETDLACPLFAVLDALFARGGHGDAEGAEGKFFVGRAEGEEDGFHGGV